jgi:hypothetical protein
VIQVAVRPLEVPDACQPRIRTKASRRTKMLALAETIKNNYAAFDLTRDTKHLNWWQSLLFWKVYLPFAKKCYAWGLPTVVAPDGTRLVLQSICTNEATARAIVAATGPLAFFKRGPVDVSLPKGEVVFGGNQFPYSDAAGMYRRNGQSEIPVVCPHTQTLCRPHDDLKRSELENLYQKTKELAEL